MIRVLIGNMFDGPAKTLVNTVNCVGVMGKGVALEFKKRYPAMFDDYVARCEVHRVRLGEPYYYSDMLGTSVVIFPTKDHWRSPSRLDDIARGLDYFAEHVREWGITSVAFPPLGCGNGGLDWSDVGPIMYQKLSALGIDVDIYAPFGTPQQQLTREFLERTATDDNATGRKNRKLNPAWLSLLEVVDRLSQQPYSPPVGRTIFQKIAYILTEQGVETGFRFREGSYGPFSDDVKDAVHVFANANLIEERRLGKMNAIYVGPEYAELKKRFVDVLKTNERKIEKTVDLFSRIKSTEQAEEVTTVLFAARKLKNGRNDTSVSEQDLHDYIVKWKKDWARDDKQKAIASSIRNLEMLGWMRLSYSDSLPAE